MCSLTTQVSSYRIQNLLGSKVNLDSTSKVKKLGSKAFGLTLGLILLLLLLLLWLVH